MHYSQKAFSIAMLESEKEAENMNSQIQLLTQNNQLQIALNHKQRQQKKLIYAVTCLLLTFAGLGLIRYKRQKEMKSRQALLSERLRISRELHDEVGATLSGIAMYTYLAREQVRQEKNAEAESSLTYMQKSAGEMVSKLSDIVWLINPEQDTILDIVGRLGEYGKQMGQARNMQMKMDLPGELSGWHIPLEARRNIYLICKEAINNAVKYSQARLVELNVKMEGPQIVFTVMDDGRGFEAAAVTKGNGLSNMKVRAEQIGAEFRLDSSPYSGTRVGIHYNLIH
jgi:signal transduction histidine kinase